MNELKFRFDKKITLSEFDKQIPKFADYFPNDISVLIKVRVKADCIEATLIENPNKNALERWEWDLNNDLHSDLEDYFQTIN